MKRTYQLYSKKHECDIQFTYTSKGCLSGFCIMDEEERTAEEMGAILGYALRLEDLQASCNNSGIKLTEVLPDLSFAAFWKTYNNTAGSKKKAESLWTKLSESQRHGAIVYIDEYNKLLAKNNTAKAYATTYLNGEYWIK